MFEQTFKSIDDILHKDDDLDQFIAAQKTFANTPQSWSTDWASNAPTTYDLSVKNLGRIRELL